MVEFSDIRHFGGLDWAVDHHDVVIVDHNGTIVLSMDFDNDADGWAHFKNCTKPFLPLGIAIETSSGAVVDRLLDAGFNVYPLQPKKAKTYRERKAPSGVKDNMLDAWSMADALRTDGHAWKVLEPDSPLTQKLRLICRDEHALVAETTAKINQLKAALREYFPAALEAFNNWGQQCAWAFLERFPTPQKLQKAGKRAWEKFLHTHKLAKSKELYDKRLEVFSRATEFCGSEAMIESKSMLALAHVKILRTLAICTKQYLKRIQDLYEKHPDYGWFSTLPLPKDGKVAPRLLSELGDHRDRFDDAQHLQCNAGTAPIYKDTGKRPTKAQKRSRRPKGEVRMRRACNHYFRDTMYWFAKVVQPNCPWSAAYMQHKVRVDKMSQSCARRCLGNRWLKIVLKMWRDRKPYDANLHMRNQLEHGSWVYRLINAKSDT